MHNLLAERAKGEAEVRVAHKALVERAHRERKVIEAKYRWPELRAQAIAARRRQLESEGWPSERLEALAANTTVSPPPGMADDIAAAVQAVFGARKRGYSEPIRRAYRARGKSFENNAIERVADDTQVSLRMVETCLKEYRAFLQAPEAEV